MNYATEDDLRHQQNQFHKKQYKPNRNKRHYHQNEGRRHHKNHHRHNDHGNFGRYNGYQKSERDIELTPEEIQKREELRQEIQGKYFDSRFVIVDSNIFMDISSDWFFDMVIKYYKDNGHRLQMFAEQYHEMNNRKNKAQWNTPIRKVATKALQRIESMIDEDVLEILNLDSTTDAEAYADGCFFDEIEDNPNNNYTIISRDLDLRIRIKNYFIYSSLC